MSEEKKAIIESMATKFTGIESDEGKSMAINIMTAYLTGVMEERERWEKKVAATA